MDVQSTDEGNEVHPAGPTRRPTLTPYPLTHSWRAPVEIEDITGKFTEGPEVLRFASTSDIPTLDPQLASDNVSITYIENLFVQLTNYDLETGEVVPEAATYWEISADARMYTFHLRGDIPWVRYNPITGEVHQEVDEDGEPRFVTAYDFEYGIKRMCDPDLGAYYNSIIAPLIVGCGETFFAEEPDDLTEADYEAIGVEAADETTLLIHLTEPAGYFLSMTPMWPMTAVPQWTIEAHGDDWIEAGLIVTSGRFVLESWIHNVWFSLVRNPLMPEDIRGGGNIEVVEVQVVPNVETAYLAWVAGGIEISGIPSEELDFHLEIYPEETEHIPDGAVFYFAYNYLKPPFDDARIRAAFSAAIDREAFIMEVRQGQGLPMIHLAPSGVIGALNIEEVGIGYDPDYARRMFAEAGYPGCENLPIIEVKAYAGRGTLSWLEFALQAWVDVLGCDPNRIEITQDFFGDHFIGISTQTPTFFPIFGQPGGAQISQINILGWNWSSVVLNTLEHTPIGIHQSTVDARILIC